MKKYEYLPPKGEEKISLAVHIQPNASKNEVLGMVNEMVKIKITAPPIDNKANKECLKFLSKILHIPKSKLHILKGQKTRSKIIQISGINRDLCRQRLIQETRGKNKVVSFSHIGKN